MATGSVKATTIDQPSLHGATSVDVAPTDPIKTSDPAIDPTTWRDRLAQQMIRLRWPLLFIGHTVAFTLAYWLAFCLRFDFHVPAEYVQRFFISLPMVLGAKLGVFCLLRSFHGWWRYVTFQDLVSLSRALVLSFFVIVVVDYFFLTVWIPRSVLIMDTVCAGILVGLSRSSWRLAREGLWPELRMPRDCKGALMITNDHEALMLAHQINSTSKQYRIVGLLTDDTKVIGSTRAGIPIVGKPEEVKLLAPRYSATEVWSVAGGIPGSRLRELKDQLESTELKIKIIPPVLNSTTDNGQIPIRDIDIRDLLQREPVVLDTEALSKQLKGRRVMVTGAGGSIGSEICRQIMRFEPSDLILLDHRENSVFLIHQELDSARRKSRRSEASRQSPVVSRQEEEAANCQLPTADSQSQLPTSNFPLTADFEASALPMLHPCVGDILDEPRMRALFEEHRPEFVYHAAAHKHVGLMECNAGQAIKNNIFGTKQVADLAKEYRSEKFVLISTDKAVNPTSVMGATKQIAERYINALAQEASETGNCQLATANSASPPHLPTDHADAADRRLPTANSGSPTQFIVVRFGNVLGSNGSVVPIFKKQIAEGGPITVTDERMTRFFMTIPEASQLVLQAATMGRGGEIFVLEMGEQVKIIELARELIRLAGLPQQAIDVKVTGMRPGEKLFEELYFDEEQMLETAHPKIHAAYHRNYSFDKALTAIESLRRYVPLSNADVRAKLKELVPEFNWNPGAVTSANVKQSSCARVHQKDMTDSNGINPSLRRQDHG